MFASIRRKKPHVYRVIILKQMADHIHLPLPSFTFIYRHLPLLAFIHLHLPPLAFIHGHLHSLAFFYLHTPTSTTISLHLPSSTSVGFHDSPEIIQRIVVPSHYSFLTNLFPCSLIFRHYTYSNFSFGHL